ncbi:ATP synthase [Thecamonas trahens ATCC 50062]|uniref:ATP synthase n=1 Tax=Thecamonas trahens ATCC 50062 TaxID=461836 RepID=A0A0L0DPW7_THETB|nr:ATP synthase [Thecamonas trahens ATCC 50062]KNC54310.1 ATP synthase [Thecamonas trahens ATCC 50062]|eukprot:XP_013753771.1 ATP synthase [Thecamonas trahens ATCC 50062]
MFSLARTRLAAATLTATRTYAATAAASSSGGAPLKLFGVSGRYATALYRAAAASKATAQVEGDLASIGGAIESSAKFAAFLKNPFVSGDEKLKVLDAALSNASKVTKAFFGVLAQSNRLADADVIIAAYRSMMIAERGEVIATVTLAQEMSSNEVAALKKELETKYLAKGESLELTTQVDKDILGGYIVEIGDKYLDLSLSTRLEDMHKLLQESI